MPQNGPGPESQSQAQGFSPGCLPCGQYTLPLSHYLLPPWIPHLQKTGSAQELSVEPCGPWASYPPSSVPSPPIYFLKARCIYVDLKMFLHQKFYPWLLVSRGNSEVTTLGAPIADQRAWLESWTLCLWSSFLLTYSLGGSTWWLRYLGLCHPCGQLRLCSGLLTSFWSSPGCGWHLSRTAYR